MIDRATVSIWGQVVGAVLWDPIQEIASFQYTPEFVKNGYELSPFKMPLDTQRIYSFIELRNIQATEENTFNGLPGLLADVLPDKYGNRLINTWLALQGRPENSMNPVEKLCFIGKRGMGALEFIPATNPRVKTFNLEMDSLVQVAAAMLNKREQFIANIKKDEQKAMQDILAIGTSAGGARAKAIIAFNEKTGEVRSGQTTAPKGFKHYLIKLDGVDDAQFGTTRGYGRIEMAYYHMALDAGIEMMPSRLLEENGRAHFMTERFDRTNGDIKHHIQTFCAMRHYDYNHVGQYSYEQLFQTMRELRLPYPQAEQLFRRMVFNVLSRNCDDHTKNFAFRLQKDKEWELSPAYDLCYAYRPDSHWVSKHSLSMNGKRENFVLDDFLTVAKSMNIKKAKDIITQIYSTVQNWKEYADRVKVYPKMAEKIRTNLPQFKL